MSGEQQFFAWLEARDPAAMAAVETVAPDLLRGMGHRSALFVPGGTDSGMGEMPRLHPQHADETGFGVGRYRISPRSDDLGKYTLDPRSLDGMGETYDPAFDPWDGSVTTDEPQTDWGRRLSEIFTGVVSAYQTKQLYDLNIRRAEMGLPPIDASALAPQVRVGLSNDMRNLLVYGGVAFLLAYFGSQFLKRR